MGSDFTFVPTSAKLLHTETVFIHIFPLTCWLEYMHESCSRLETSWERRAWDPLYHNVITMLAIFGAQVKIVVMPPVHQKMLVKWLHNKYKWNDHGSADPNEMSMIQVTEIAINVSQTFQEERLPAAPNLRLIHWRGIGIQINWGIFVMMLVGCHYDL